MNYQKAKALFESARSPHAGKPLENNTRLFMRPSANGGKPSFAVQLHSTDILTFRPDGAVVYNTGGWETLTTKDRMNGYGPANIWSDRGTWRIGHEGVSAVFADGCRIYRGRIVGAARDDKRERKLRLAVKAYVAEYMRLMLAGEMEAPSAGDCLMCRLAWNGEPAPTRPDPEHIRAHIKERYYVPSLAWAAARAMGASIADKQQLRHFQYKDCPPFMSGDWFARSFTRTLRRYMLRELGMSS